MGEMYSRLDPDLHRPVDACAFVPPALPAGIVHRNDDHILFSGQHVVGNIEGKTRIAGFIARSQNAVDIDHAFTHHAFERKEDAGVRSVFRHHKLVIIPADPAGLKSIGGVVFRQRHLEGVPIVGNGDIHPGILFQEDVHHTHFRTDLCSGITHIMINAFPSLHIAEAKLPAIIEIP